MSASLPQHNSLDFPSFQPYKILRCENFSNQEKSQTRYTFTSQANGHGFDSQPRNLQFCVSYSSARQRLTIIPFLIPQLLRIPIIEYWRTATNYLLPIGLEKDHQQHINKWTEEKVNPVEYKTDAVQSVTTATSSFQICHSRLKLCFPTIFCWLDVLRYLRGLAPPLNQSFQISTILERTHGGNQRLHLRRYDKH